MTEGTEHGKDDEMSNDMSVKIKTLVGPKSGATISVDLEVMVPDGSSILPERLEIDPECANLFEVTDVRFVRSRSRDVPDVIKGATVQLATGHPAGTSTVHFNPEFVERHQPVFVSVQNLSDVAATFSAQLVGKLCAIPNREESPEDEKKPADDLSGFLSGLAGKCRRWFDEGLAAVLLAKQEEDLEELRSDELEPSSPRDLLVRLVADVINFVRIPFSFAVEGWLSTMVVKEDTPRRERKVSVAVGPVEVEAGDRVEISVRPLIPFRPTSLMLDPNHCHDFVVDDVRVGHNSQFLTTSSIAGIFFAGGLEGLPVGIDQSVPGVDIMVSVTNVSGEKQIFQGALVGVVEIS